MFKTHKSSTGARIGMDRYDRAEDWFARLRAPGCTDIERAAFRRWLYESPDNDAAYRQVEAAWRRSAELRTTPAIADATREALDARVPRLPRKLFVPSSWFLANNRQRATNNFFSRHPIAAAAALALAVGLSFLGAGLELPGLTDGESFVTATAEQRTITLTDGSRVLLDAESVLRVDYGDEVRNLVLERGQAEFKVAHDADRPFVVEAGGSLVRALGTEFQVRVDGGEAIVTLLEGKVRVDVPGLLGGILIPPKHEVLEPGQKVEVVGRRKPLEPEPADLEVAKAWPRGDLVFKRWRLEDLVAEMNRHSDIRLQIEDAALRDLLVSGRFRAGDQKSLIQALEQEWSIRARRIEPRRIALTMRGSSG